MLVDEQDIKLNNVNTSSITHCCMLVKYERKVMSNKVPCTLITLR